MDGTYLFMLMQQVEGLWLLLFNRILFGILFSQVNIYAHPLHYYYCTKVIIVISQYVFSCNSLISIHLCVVAGVKSINVSGHKYGLVS